MSQSSLVTGLPQLPRVKGVRHTCVLAKHHEEKRFPKVSQSSQPLQLIHSNLCSPVQGQNSSMYILTLIDDYSQFTWVYFLSQTSETFDTFEILKLIVNWKPTIRSDRGGEYMSTKFLDFCRQHGIRCQLTIAHTPHQNGTCCRAKKLGLSLRVLAASSGISISLWTKSVHTTNYIENRPGAKALHRSTTF